MLGLILAANVSHAICTAVELGLPEAMAERAAKRRRSRCWLPRAPRQLGRLMTVLASFGVLARSGDECFELSTEATITEPEQAPKNRSQAGWAVVMSPRW
jgi:hypothetical protein